LLVAVVAELVVPAEPVVGLVVSNTEYVLVAYCLTLKCPPEKKNSLI
jgi:hypothetical protein